jgi:hypothetical protein
MEWTPLLGSRSRPPRGDPNSRSPHEPAPAHGREVQVGEVWGIPVHHSREPLSVLDHMHPICHFSFVALEGVLTPVLAALGQGSRMDEWVRQEVVNEVRSRSRNEWIEKTNEDFGGLRPTDDYVCECSFAGCSSTITLTHDEYEHVRSDGTHFVIALNHEHPEIDRVIGETDRFAIIEKWLGEPREMARESDPRRN